MNTTKVLPAAQATKRPELFLNLRVTDIERFYERCRARGATFITEPKVHAKEVRCYMCDLDGYLIEIGQTTFTKTPLEMYK